MKNTDGVPEVRNVVLVHGGFVDGSGWQGVYTILTKSGYQVSVVQNPTISLDGDVAATRRVLDAQPGPVILVWPSARGRPWSRSAAATRSTCRSPLRWRS